MTGKEGEVTEGIDWSIAPPLKVDLAKVKVRKLRARYDFHPDEDWQLSFNKGDIIIVIDQHPGEPANTGLSAWWEGQIGKRAGIFPISYCEPVELVRTRMLRVNTTHVAHSIRRLQTSAFGLRAVLVGDDANPGLASSEPVTRSGNIPDVSPSKADAPPRPALPARFAELARSALKNHRNEVAQLAAAKFEDLKKQLEAQTDARRKAESRLQQLEAQFPDARTMSDQVSSLIAENEQLKAALDPKEDLLQARFTQISSLMELVAKYKEKYTSQRNKRKSKERKLLDEVSSLERDKADLQLKLETLPQDYMALEEKYQREKEKRAREKEKRSELKQQLKSLKHDKKGLEKQLSAAGQTPAADGSNELTGATSGDDALTSPRSPSLRPSHSSSSLRRSSLSNLSPSSSFDNSRRVKDLEAMHADRVQRFQQEISDLRAEVERLEHKRSKAAQERDSLRELVVSVQEQLRKKDDLESRATMQQKLTTDVLLKERDMNIELHEKLHKAEARVQELEKKVAHLNGEVYQMGDSMLAQEDTISSLANTIEELEDLIESPEDTSDEHPADAGAPAVAVPRIVVQPSTSIETGPPPVPEIASHVREKYKMWHSAMTRIRVATTLMRRRSSTPEPPAELAAPSLASSKTA